MIKYADVVFGLCWGDEGKGKIINAICDQYDMVCRWNGGPNAGHTIYLNNKKYKTHIIPSGVFRNKKSIIGPNCVINLEKFYQEIEYLKNQGFDTSLIKVSPKTHLITENHVSYDLRHLKDRLGTTGQGIAPAYADKMLRIGKLAKDHLDKKYLWDEVLEGKILCEGAQSFWLDINYGNYPYVTSSETLPYSCCSLGFSPTKIKNIIGVAKIYDTKSGVDPAFPNDLWNNPILNSIIELGEEYGSTTGRKRLVNWLNLDKLIYAINKSGINKIIFNKCDILQKVKIYKIQYSEKIIEFSSMKEMKFFINSKIKRIVKNIIYSGDKSYI